MIIIALININGNNNSNNNCDKCNIFSKSLKIDRKTFHWISIIPTTHPWKSPSEKTMEF